MRSPARQSTTIIGAQPPTVSVVSGVAHDGDDLIDRRRVGGVVDSLVARGRPAW
jgi:hypothetical protein